MNDSFDSVEFASTLLPKPATLLPKTATMSKQQSTLSKGRHFTIKSFDIVAVCGNKVERCFDNVAGVDGALGSNRLATVDGFMRLTSAITSASTAPEIAK